MNGREQRKYQKEKKKTLKTGGNQNNAKSRR